MVNSLKRAESRMAFGSNLVKPSELFGSVKRTINRNRQSRCQCKHHQQKLLAKQEEQRQQLQDQLRSQGCQSFLKCHVKLQQPPHLQNSTQKTPKRHQLLMSFPCVFRFLSCVFGFLSSETHYTRKSHQKLTSFQMEF